MVEKNQENLIGKPQNHATLKSFLEAIIYCLSAWRSISMPCASQHNSVGPQVELWLYTMELPRFESPLFGERVVVGSLLIPGVPPCNGDCYEVRSLGEL